MPASIRFGALGAFDPPEALMTLAIIAIVFLTACAPPNGADAAGLGAPSQDTADLKVGEPTEPLPMAEVAPPVIAVNGFSYPLSTMASWPNGNYGACGTNYYAGQCHNGVDLIYARGTAVYSLAAGTVLRQSATQDPTCSSGWGYDTTLRTCNRALTILYYDDDGNPFVVVLGHMQYDTRFRSGTGSVSAQVGRVQPGELLGYIGGYFDTSGRRISSDHLHFGVFPGASSPTVNLGMVPCAASQPANVQLPAGCSSNGATPPGTWMAAAGRNWMAPPAVPTLSSPAAGSVVAAGVGGTASVQLSWRNGSGTYRTHGMVCQDRALSVGCINPDGAMVGFEPQPFVTSQSVTLGRGTWYWTARGIAYNDYGGWGPYAPVRLLTVR